MDLKSPRPDLSVSTETARSIVGRILPDADVTAVRSLASGNMGAVFELVLAGEIPPLMLKVYPEAYSWMLQKGVNVAHLMRDQIGTLVPDILLADASKTLLPLSFVLMSKIEGENLRSVENALSARDVTSAYRLMGEVLRKLHRRSMGGFGYIGPQGLKPAHASNCAYVRSQFDRKTREFIDRGGDTQLAERITNHISARAHLLHACKEGVLCHNDFHGSNVLVAGRDENLRLAGVLDFDNAHAADPLMDLAKTLFCAPEMDDARRAALLEGYGPLEREDWRETVHLYRLYFNVEFWCWMAMLGNGQMLPGLSRDIKRQVSA